MLSTQKNDKDSRRNDYYSHTYEYSKNDHYCIGIQKMIAIGIQKMIATGIQKTIVLNTNQWSHTYES